MNQTATATTALLDQTDAAGADAMRVLRALAEMPGGAFQIGRGGIVTRGILTRLGVGLLAGSIVCCDHISLTAPAPAFWGPWAPGRVRCPPCFVRSHERIQGSREDHTCDKCRRYSVKIHVCAAQLPGIVVEHVDGRAHAVPPVQVHFGLCSGCYATDQDTTDQPTDHATSDRDAGHATDRTAA